MSVCGTGLGGGHGESAAWGAWSTPPSPVALAQAVVLGLRFLLVGQLPTGEIASFRRAEGGELDYVSSPLASAIAHDALAPLDPTAAAFVGDAALSALLVPPPVRRHALATAAAVRRGLRRFLAWQERPDGRWSFFGRGSGLAPDAATTACATAALLGGPHRRGAARIAATRADAGAAAGGGGANGAARAIGTSGPAPPLRLRLAALGRHRSAGGPFFTYVDEAGRGWSSLDPRGSRQPGFDRVVNAWVLRCLALGGAPDAELAAWVLGEAAAADLATADHPNPLRFVHAATRAWADGHLPHGDRLAERLAPRLAAWQQPNGGFDGALSTGLALTALLDLAAITDAGSADTAAAARALVAAAGTDGGWPVEDYLAGGAASRALSTAVAVGALARFAAAGEEPWR